MTAPTLLWTLIAESLLILSMFGGVVFYVVRDTRSLRDRLTLNSRALHRYIKHLQSPEFRGAEAAQLRTRIGEELEGQWRERLAAAEQESGRLRAQLSELEAKGSQTPTEALEPVAEDDDELLDVNDPALRGDATLQAGVREELERLKALVASQEGEIDRLRGQVVPGRLDAATSRLLDMQQDQRGQQQRMLREMEVCLQVLENELSQTRGKLLLAVSRLRDEKLRNQALRARLRNGHSDAGRRSSLEPA